MPIATKMEGAVVESQEPKFERLDEPPQRPETTRRDLLALAGTFVATAVSAAVPANAAPGKTEGYFLVYDPRGGGSDPDTGTRIFFIASEWLQYFEVTDVYRQMNMDPAAVASKIRQSSSSKVRSLKALYGDVADIQGPVGGTTLDSASCTDGFRNLLGNDDLPQCCSFVRRQSSMFCGLNFDAFRKGLTDRSRDRPPKVSYSRTKTSEETYAAVRQLMRAAGITRVADVTGLDRLGIPVVMVARPNSRGLSVSQGKGGDLISAKVSGLMEALESFHAERPDIPIRLLSWSELAGTGRAVDPSRLPQRKTNRLDPDRRIAWGQARDLVSNTDRLIPLDLIHTDFSYPLMPGGGVFPVSSNGLASGNTYAEAVCQGLCELIERDAFALFSAARDPCPRHVDPSTSKSPAMRDVLTRIESAGAHLSVWDLTSDIGVPVFYAKIVGGSDSPVTAMAAGGLGCHPDQTWACLRAIYEATQSRLTRLAGARDDLTPENFRHPLRRDDGTQTISAVPLPLDTGIGPTAETVEDDLCWLIEKLQQRGLNEVLVTDLGRPEFGLPVVRVVVPGLERPPSADVAPGNRVQRIS